MNRGTTRVCLDTLERGVSRRTSNSVVDLPALDLTTFVFCSFEPRALKSALALVSTGSVCVLFCPETGIDTQF
eukprot:3190553-Amphidinium_carterae.1